MARYKKWLCRHDRKRETAKQPQLSFDLSNPLLLNQREWSTNRREIDK